MELNLKVLLVLQSQWASSFPNSVLFSGMKVSSWNHEAWAVGLPCGWHGFWAGPLRTVKFAHIKMGITVIEEHLEARIFPSLCFQWPSRQWRNDFNNTKYKINKMPKPKLVETCHFLAQFLMLFLYSPT